MTCLELANSVKPMRPSGARVATRDDPLISPTSAHGFLERSGVLSSRRGAGLSERDMTELRDLRDSVEHLLSHLVGQPGAGARRAVPTEGVVVLNRLAGRCRWTLRVAPDLTPSYAPSHNDPVAAVAGLCAQELSECDATRLRVCERPECQRYFYDTTRNRSARWHSEDPCGWRIRSERRAAGLSRVS